MKPTFKTPLAWEQAQALMQPALLRVVDNIRKELESSNWKGTYKEVTTPIPGYHLCLSRPNYQVEIDIWELCYKVCFQQYEPIQHIFSYEDETAYPVEIDTRLIDDFGEIDWQLLESKAQQFVRKAFSNLPE
ncbi:hypothetical protein I4641_13030 [Waterburya agarophytonicola K14]|uniref:Uncharacterized protein n=1 Tax=Waterburya agarophytonicola KI4 TaxID=2874699 RepID=A0A964BTI2_9CYAN|nr:hypothetical protein [Waterburya agarophytonicola]MCC0177902.1 hypothetical protein [Waterburya agarophytonicola KI4]